MRARMFRVKFLQRTGKNACRHGRSVADPQDFCARFIAHALNRQFGARDNLTRLFVKALACFRQRHRVFAPLQERHGKFLLEIFHLPAQRGLREVKRLRSAIEGSMLRDGDEVTKVAKFHRVSLFIPKV